MESASDQQSAADLPAQESITANPVLGYGQQPRKWIGRRLFFVIGSVIFIALLAYVGRPFYQPLVDQIVFLSRQRQISWQALPPGTVIYTEDPARIAILRTDSKYRDKNAMFPSTTNHFPPTWERISAVDYFDAMSGTSISHFQVEDTFSWRRTSANGTEWIVHLPQDNAFMIPPGLREKAGDRRWVCVTQGAFTVAGWKPGQRGREVSYMSPAFALSDDDVLTLFAPQTDAADASRINVDFELNGIAGQLRGIVDDNGRVVFTIDHGPGRLVLTR